MPGTALYNGVVSAGTQDKKKKKKILHNKVWVIGTVTDSSDLRHAVHASQHKQTAPPTKRSITLASTRQLAGSYSRTGKADKQEYNLVQQCSGQSLAGHYCDYSQERTAAHQCELPGLSSKHCCQSRLTKYTSTGSHLSGTTGKKKQKPKTTKRSQQ
jgi:hypothetical protein